MQTIEWRNNSVRIIDQRKLPARLEYVYLRNPAQLWQAIRLMKIRGAPALGAAAALGVYLGIKDSTADNFSEFSRRLDRVAEYLISCRPTARNLFWAIERVCSVAVKNKDKPVSQIKRLIFSEAMKIISEDKEASRRIGVNAGRLVHSGDTILTICNAGMLATIDYGTALGVIYRAKEEGKKIKVFACETRPMLQGARLTVWELRRKGIKVTLICDSMAADLMRKGKVSKVIVGADRIAANGDTANKIGTYNLAVLAFFHHVPLYVAAPSSTFDLKINSGRDIPIEERDAKEVTALFFKKPIAPAGISVYNPAFDVTPHNLINAIITEKGIIRPPYRKNISRVLLGR